MKNFKDFGIKPEIASMTGEKIKISKILNREIVVHDFRIEESKFKKENAPSCLHMQISLDDVKHVVFTGSQVLANLIVRIPKDYFPFKTTIIKENERYEFS